MENAEMSSQPEICYRPIQPSDLHTLQCLHDQLFPMRYECTFYQDVVNEHDNIVSWGAVDRSRPDGQSDELVGFVTTKIIRARESEIVNILGHESTKTDRLLVYVLTLGVLPAYRNLGIASSLIRMVIKYASDIPTCRAVYLQAKANNKPAINFYEKMSFNCVKGLPKHYLINGQHYDGCLFVHYVNGGRSHRTPLGLLKSTLSHMRSGLKLVRAKLQQEECKESDSLVSAAHNKGHLAPECVGHDS